MNETIETELMMQIVYRRKISLVFQKKNMVFLGGNSSKKFFKEIFQLSKLNARNCR